MKCDEKMALCETMKAKGGNIIQPLITVLHRIPQIREKAQRKNRAFSTVLKLTFCCGLHLIMICNWLGYIGGISTPELIETYDEVRFLSDSSLKRRKADAIKKIAQMLVVSEEQYQMVILNMNEL